MIIDLQRRLAEIGRIRIGQQVQAGRNGKTRPEKLATFRLTSPDKVRIDHAARLYGGQPQQWQAPAGKQWEVITTADAIDVIVPPSDMAFSQHYELWSAGGCQRRCDGSRESISDGDCLCDPDARECDIHTRLSVLLRDLPGLGVWRIDTSGYYAAVELQGAVEVIQIAAGKGQMLPARLRLEQRAVKRPDQPVRRFAVPVLDVEVSPGQLMAGHAPAQLGNGHAAIASAPESPAGLTAVPTSVPSAPARSVADQAREVDGNPERSQRRNAAQPIAPTGIRPRTAAEAHAAERDDAEGRVPDERDHDSPFTATREQIGKIQTVYSSVFEFKRAEHALLIPTTEQIIGAELGTQQGRKTHNSLSHSQASALIDTLARIEGMAHDEESPRAMLTAFLARQAQDDAGEQGAGPDGGTDGDGTP